MTDRFDDDRYCFVCGEENPRGLHLKPQGEGGAGKVVWTPRKWHQGFSGVVHGGFIATVMDEAMAYAAMSAAGFCATAEITVKFRKQVLTDMQVEVNAKLVERRGRILKLEASLIQDGEEKAAARATFISVPGGAKQSASR